MGSCKLHDLFGLALTDIGRRVRSVSYLKEPLDRLGSGGVGQKGQLVQRSLGLGNLAAGSS